MGNILQNLNIGQLGGGKAVISILAMVVAAVMAHYGQVSGAEAFSFVKWVVTGWLGATAVENAAQHLAGSLPAAKKPTTDEGPKPLNG